MPTVNHHEEVDDVLRRILELVKRERIRVFRNVLGMPYISCDGQFETHPQPPIHASLFDPSVRQWFLAYVWDVDHVRIHTREISELLELLAGLSLRHKTTHIADPEILAILESQPVVASVVEFMQTVPGGRYENTMDGLWHRLREFAGERQLLVLRGHRFPGGPNVLSRKLHNFHDVIEKLGVEITIRRSNGARVTLRRLDGSEEQPSAESSARNSTPTRDLRPADDRQAILAGLIAIQNQTTSPPPQETDDDADTPNSAP